MSKKIILNVVGCLIALLSMICGGCSENIVGGGTAQDAIKVPITRSWRIRGEMDYNTGTHKRTIF